MASIRKCASEVIDTARDGIGWFALWKAGRSWHVMEVYADDYDYDTGALILGFPEDKQEIERILTEDPHAVMLNGYYCNLGDLEYMTVNSLADALRWQYEIGGNALANWTFKSETPEDRSDSETTTSEPDNTGNETQPYIPAATCAGLSLSEEEIEFFEDTVARVKYSVNVNVPIEIMDHDQLTGKHKEALGICWAKYDSAGNRVPYRITIDEFFVHECFVAIEKPYMKLEPESLEQVIAHEIAHLHHWRHGKKHTELTRYICRLIEKGEPHEMGDGDTPAAPETGSVLIAAMQPTNMKKRYKEIRKIHASALRQLCIEKDWYTAGDNDEYGHLLLDLAEHKGNLTTADIIEIAEDIMEHSEIGPDYTVEDVAFDVACIAVVSFKEVKYGSCSQKQLADAERVTQLETEIEQLKSDIELLSSALENERAVSKNLEQQLERQTLTDDELTDVKRMTIEKRLAIENEIKSAAERIVKAATETESAAFQDAVKAHRNAQGKLEYCTALLERLTEIGEQ